MYNTRIREDLDNRIPMPGCIIFQGLKKMD